MKLLTNYLSNTDYDNAIDNEDIGYPNTSFIQETSVLHILNDKVDYSTQYFNLTPHEDANIEIIPSGSTFFCAGRYMYISYSIDNCETWNQVPTDTNATVSVKAGDKIYFKASLYNQHQWTGEGVHSQAKIYTCDKQYTVAGNILSLIYEDDFLGDDIVAQDTLSGYFVNDTNLVDARNLYLAPNMESWAYDSMFKNCTSLVHAPELPATTLAEGCYYQMFFGCTSLVNAPELPATTLAQECYLGMFRGCTSLVTAPELPATTLVEKCYREMFKGCTSLNNITMLATDISATDCLYYWVEGVSYDGTFYKHPDMNDLEINGFGIPYGWTVVDYAA